MPGSGSCLRQRAGISVTDFYNALNGLWLRKDGPHRRKNKNRLAIAVSGGVDSMALAQLCAMLQRNRLAFPGYQYIRAFIVDHKAREGSQREANMVKSRLLRLNITSTILSLEWPPNVQPLELSDFETQARRLRYQALGAACRAENIVNLLLAHHADDQAETVLMRLSSGHKNVGVQGMHPVSNIPECWGIHGVHKSGKCETALDVQFKKSFETRIDLLLDSSEQRNQRLLSSGLFENGGVQVLRPLLNFRKQDLIDTCQANGVEWSEDATNKDTWRTTRNATRSLLGSSCLPMALETPSLVQLSLRLKGREVRHNNCTSRLNDLSEIMIFDLRSGHLVVRLPRLKITEIGSMDAVQSRSSMSRPLIASILIRRLSRLVTPCEDVPLHSLKCAVTSMFPSLARSKSAKIEEQIEPSKFTTAGVLFERIHSSMSDVDARSNSDPILEDRELRNGDPDTNNLWSLSRQPFANASKMQNTPTTIMFDGALSRREDASDSSLWSTWRLWDGRYWIRIKNLTDQALMVRPFYESDLRAIRISIPKSMRKPFEKVLGSAAPNKVRWTLPVIAHAVEEEGKVGKVIALPTLGKTGILDLEDEKGQRKVEWQVRYKMIDRDTHDDTRRSTIMVMSWEDS